MSKAMDFNLAAIAEAVADAVTDRKSFVFQRDPTLTQIGLISDEI